MLDELFVASIEFGTDVGILAHGVVFPRSVGLAEKVEIYGRLSNSLSNPFRFVTIDLFEPNLSDNQVSVNEK